MDDQERLISERAAATILRRAAEIDSQEGENVSVAVLHEAANQAGISSAAFERALAEHSRLVRMAIWRYRIASGFAVTVTVAVVVIMVAGVQSGLGAVGVIKELLDIGR